MPPFYGDARLAEPNAHTRQIVRADYSDPLYQKFALDALAEWRSPRWRKHFHECGVVVVSASSHPQATYVRNSHALNAQSSPPSVGPLHAEGDIRRFYPAGLRTGEFPGDVAYRNSVGGWAASRDAVVECIDLARALGVRFVHAEADALVHADGSTKGPVRGVRTKEGKTLEADFVILACGSWTPRLLPELATNCLPTGQTVATVKLSEDEMKEYDDMPVRCFPTVNQTPTLTYSLLALFALARLQVTLCLDTGLCIALSSFCVRET